MKPDIRKKGDTIVQTLKDINHLPPSKPKYCNVKSEFRRIIKTFDQENQFEFYDSEDRTKKSFS